MPGERILIVEDDEKIASMLQQLLGKHGYQTSLCHDGAVAVDRILEEDPAVVVLDVMLPGLDGLEVCRRVRDHFSGSIMILTALDDDMDELLGLEAGADDFLVKSTASRLIVARVASLLRQQRRWCQQEDVQHDIDLNWLRISVENREAWLYGRLMELTSGEFDLLLYFARHAGYQLTRERIAREVFGQPTFDPLDRSVDLRIARLRKRIHAAGGDGSRLIKSVRGVGYLLLRHHELQPT